MGVVVGVEADALGVNEWEKSWGRQLQVRTEQGAPLLSPGA